MTKYETTVYEDHLKPGESNGYDGANWRVVLSKNHIVVANHGGFWSEDEARRFADDLDLSFNSK